MSGDRRDSEKLDGTIHVQSCAVTKPRFYTRINSVDFGDVAAPDQGDSRMCVVRYFLDRPGYGLHNSAARLWFDPPSTCTPAHVYEFLKKQGIALDGLLVEVYLDKFESFMMLEACEASLVDWQFGHTTRQEPGVLSIRLTDLAHALQEEHTMEDEKKKPAPQVQQQQQARQSDQANTIPAGLYAFSLMVGLETAELMSRLIPGSVDESFVLIWGPSMMFSGGLLQVIVGILQVFRNNIYGATAFLVFGCIWFSNGSKVILETYFTWEGSRADYLLESKDPWGSFIRSVFMFGFVCVLWKQTFVMNRLSTTLISLLCIKAGVGAFAGWSTAMQWIQLVVGWATSAFAFYVFMVELTNQVYHREVFSVFKWSDKHSPEEVFGAAGRVGTLHSKATRLRQANYMNVRRVREANTQESRSETEDS